MAKGDEDFAKALKEPLYAQIREFLFGDNTNNEVLETKTANNDLYVLPTEQTLQAEGQSMNDKPPNSHATNFESGTVAVVNKKAPGEIEEIEEEKSQPGSLEEDRKESQKTLNNPILEKFYDNSKKKVVISAEVDQALGILEKVISLFREYGSNPETRPPPTSAEDNQNCSNGEDVVDRNSHEARNSSCSQGSRYMFADAKHQYSLLSPR